MDEGPTAWCTNHAQQFRKVAQEVDDDGARSSESSSMGALTVAVLPKC